MIDRARLYERLRREPSASTVLGSLPVLFFGDLFGARVATVGLNPSNQEYTTRDGVMLTGSRQRFATAATLINNAVARVAGLIGVSAVGVVVAQMLIGDTFAANEESVHAFHQVVLICSALLAAGGVVGAVGIVNPRRAVEARTCPGGQLVGVPLPAVEHRGAEEPSADVPPRPIPARS